MPPTTYSGPYGVYFTRKDGEYYYIYRKMLGGVVDRVDNIPHINKATGRKYARLYAQKG